MITSFDVVIIGSGAAGYSTADWLYRLGIKNIAILTEGKSFGTSRNAGSDKQTYYKLSQRADDVIKMAQSLFDGGGMHGDTAMIEAANSTRSFLRLVEYGVPFPRDEFGIYAGYQTDHDNTERAVSAGPLTSKYMTEVLEKKAIEKNIEMIDHFQVIKVVVKNGHAVGVVGLAAQNESYDIVAIAAKNIVLATGGAGTAYLDSVYPYSQTGAMALAIEAGCVLNNIIEWQFGIASTQFRWNLSGSYQQVMPKYYSEDESGVKYDFLDDYYKNPLSACDNIFLKGYQWPFDSDKLNGSSRIDILVQSQKEAGRRVFIDFRENSNGYDFNSLAKETKDYLTKAKSIAETPYERLIKLNPKAVQIYQTHDIDLSKQPLEIAVCAQHMNGGIAVDSDWQSSVAGLFAVGEVAGTFGIYRPGGAALNSTQVGGLRVAEYIKKQFKNSPDKTNIITEISENDEHLQVLEEEMAKQKEFIRCSAIEDKDDLECEGRRNRPSIVVSGNAAEDAGGFHGDDVEIVEKITDEKWFRRQMSLVAGVVKHREMMGDFLAKLSGELKNYSNINKINNNATSVRGLYKRKENLIFQHAFCKALLDMIPILGTHGGTLYIDKGEIIPKKYEVADFCTITKNEKTEKAPLRPMPKLEENFETIWQKFIERNISIE